MAVSAMALQSIASHPNFVVIMTDDQGYQDLGCYGSPDIRTPHLDKLAADGMKFISFLPLHHLIKNTISTGKEKEKSKHIH